jgi:poly[(R)-3-hydroxyalkanoate] polymerase subunit PhaC
MSAETIEPAAADAAAAPLDLLLTDAALGALNRVNPGGSGLRLAAALAARPGLVAGRTRNLLGELARIAAGTSQVQPSRRDQRFADPGWAGNPLLHRVLQAYLAAAQTAQGLAQDADLDWSDTERVGFVLRNLIDAVAPSNNPVLNPAALKAAIDTAAAAPWRACGVSPPTWRARRGYRRWSSRTRSRSGWISRSRPGRWCCGPKCSS